jgi:UDP-N-acetylmuramate dehydrogenase
MPSMDLLRDVSLAEFSTMGLGGRVKYLASILNRDDLIEALNFATQNKLPVLMIGSGSNIIWQDEGFNGLLLVNNIRGFDIENGDDEGSDIVIGAGEKWDLAVDRAVSLGLSGIECLSLVPGNAGATPVQNVGAYGQEISETLVSLEAYDNKNKTFLTMLNEDCDFSYRNSCFRKEPGRYFILSIRLHLKKDQIKPPLYKALEQYLNSHNIADLSPASIRRAVINIRRTKLPDPNTIRNCGSFFKNPIVTKEKYEQLLGQYEGLPGWETSDGQMKLSAAWLIEKAGFKDYTDNKTGMATWKEQPLILVNQSAKNTEDLLHFRDEIIRATKDMFDVELVQEPQLLP